MKSSPTRAAIGAATLLLTLAVAGCEEAEPADPVTPTGKPIPAATSRSTEPSTTTGPVMPTLPAEAMTETKAGAMAFVEYYWAVVNYAQATGDTELLRSLAIDSCAGCDGGASSIERIYRRGGQIIGGHKRVVENRLTHKPSGGWIASQTISVNRQRIRGAGTLDQVSTPGRVDVVLGISFQDGSWAVTSLEV